MYVLSNTRHQGAKPSISHCNIQLLFWLNNGMDKDYEKNKAARGSSLYEQESDTSKDIKKGMDRYEGKIKSGEAPGGDATSSDE
jgi:hypothetical protein